MYMIYLLTKTQIFRNEIFTTINVKISQYSAMLQHFLLEDHNFQITLSIFVT